MRHELSNEKGFNVDAAIKETKATNVRVPRGENPSHIEKCVEDNRIKTTAKWQKYIFVQVKNGFTMI